MCSPAYSRGSPTCRRTRFGSSMCLASQSVETRSAARGLALASARNPGAAGVTSEPASVTIVKAAATWVSTGFLPR
jgi:hypothetical protein